MEKWISLSHVLETNTPGFGGEQGFFREEKSCICKGRNSNSEKWILANHHGTHVDCPYHFHNDGKKMTDYNDLDWIFNRTFLIEIPVSLDDIIQLNNYDFEKIPLECDFLIIKTGFEKVRAKSEYWKNNPGLAPEIGFWLRKQRPQLKAIGFDFISLTAYQNRPLGKEAHLAFLSPDDEHEGIRIIEDMKLSLLEKNPGLVLVSPLLVKDADGGPVNVWAKV